jgi:hypothetical protein
MISQRPSGDYSALVACIVKSLARYALCARMLKLGREGADGYEDSALGITAGPEAQSSAAKEAALTAKRRQSGRSSGCKYIAKIRGG